MLLLRCAGKIVLWWCLVQVYVDKAFQEEVEQLPVKCSYHDRGCKWQSTLVNLNVSIRARSSNSM